MNAERVIREYACLYKHKSLSDKIIHILAAFYHAMQLSGRKYHSRILYPAGGLNNLFRKAKENLDRLGVNIILNDKVTTLRYLTDPREGYQYESKTKAGNSYLSKSITSSSILSLEAIYINDKFIKPYYFINQSDHFTFLTQSSTNGYYGFAKVIDDEYFELVSDVSPFTPGLMDKHPGCKIVTCRFLKKQDY